uniref:Uncharacterized protein n=1 Tax=Arundo donax TaxID=35708 RepID=A0A0A9FH19_ARUDO
MSGLMPNCSINPVILSTAAMSFASRKPFSNVLKMTTLGTTPASFICRTHRNASSNLPSRQ